ncbi:T9SS-dependent choice-of-anchor J family protein [Epilithonimonas xixisoli]|uniref:Putative secreted protein (Por secretion system target) n=1 Tax=Epilithonimonas xixisoli TaxID=1476462 RepID=A0A4R8IHU9_9FLAO|nr:choice-of-anchor J domain-containing protein [Epilithonimonas xixisoli]TDX86455.1 putative secreted protein (Por secretion system target) [Epilithonimonas xixisoli]
MKAKLFLVASLFAVIAQAQLTTINEDFSNFTAGPTSFPQYGWSIIVPPNPLPNPPAPFIRVIENGTAKTVQAYPGNSSNQPLYLITPQIVAPAGDKTISFDTGLVASSPGTTTIQIGIATNPTDMVGTFVPVGDPIPITSTTVQNVKVNIPQSAGTYLVIRHTPTAPHTALEIDNVKYDVSLAVNESAFNNNFKFAVSPDNNSLRFVSNEQLSTAKVYSSTGQLATEGKITNNALDITRLKTGVYFIVIENANGQSVKSKFIKK